jgi:hypothetical protein
MWFYSCPIFSDTIVILNQNMLMDAQNSSFVLHIGAITNTNSNNHFFSYCFFNFKASTSRFGLSQITIP